ncbi:MAG: pyridoxamine 5'-phosphate oxidase family protein [Chloroflexi bacterium]|nr:pyridoxamine 5'-phosphate oxidase family protein [Chloroflexota bacterium]MCI0863777.1 pyridoxamine 5'-phosphate oxidase family protein [Chloroflexota bacterium]
MIDMNGEMKELVDRAHADGWDCTLGTVDKDGQPQLSLKGSVMVFDSETLAYWERAKRTALENVAANPKVTILYNNMKDRIRWRFYGTAVVYESGPIREEVMSRTVEAELERDPERLGVAVLIKVNKIAELAGNVLQER